MPGAHHQEFYMAAHYIMGIFHTNCCCIYHAGVAQRWTGLSTLIRSSGPRHPKRSAAHTDERPIPIMTRGEARLVSVRP